MSTTHKLNNMLAISTFFSKADHCAMPVVAAAHCIYKLIPTPRNTPKSMPIVHEANKHPHTGATCMHLVLACIVR
jgi:hypothetical protein